MSYLIALFSVASAFATSTAPTAPPATTPPPPGQEQINARRASLERIKNRQGDTGQDYFDLFQSGMQLDNYQNEQLHEIWAYFRTQDATIKKQKEKIDEKQKDIDDLKTRVVNLEKSVKDLETRVKDNETAIQSNKTNIAGNSDKITPLQTASAYNTGELGKLWKYLQDVLSPLQTEQQKHFEKLFAEVGALKGKVHTHSASERGRQPEAAETPAATTTEAERTAPSATE